MITKSKKSMMYATAFMPIAFSVAALTTMDQDSNNAKIMIILSAVSALLSKVSLVSFTLWEGSNCNVYTNQNNNESPSP